MLLLILNLIFRFIEENRNSHVILTSVMYCSIIRGECHLVARIFKRDYNAFLPIGAWRSPVARLHGVQEVPSSNLGAPTCGTSPT
jgi:hypothetical protein